MPPPWDVEAAFGRNYQDARDRFRSGCAASGVSPRSYVEPGCGPAGEKLATDAAWFGPEDASGVIVLTAGTHGVEGFCGSGAQVDLLRSGALGRLPDGVAVLMIHALNPFGFAHLRRVTQENVDLNRNGVNFAAPLPQNAGYEAIRHALSAAALSGPTYATARAALECYAAEHGDAAYRVARGSGQYTDPHGIHYGGSAPTWSRCTLERIIREFHLHERHQVAVVDYHTGLGPFGYGEPICGSRPDEPGAARARDWYGESLTEPMLGTSTSVVIPGLTQYIWLRELGPAPLTFIALEYGTFPRNEMHAAGEAEHWLHNHAAATDPAEQQRIKARFRRAYFPDTAAWKEMVLSRSRQIISQTARGMAAALA